MTETEIRKPGRPRNAQADQAILQAALELIAQDGVQGMSVEGVAALAGVSKATIYRRWAGRDALIIDALRQIKTPVIAFDTGNFREDMTHLLLSLRSLMDDPLNRLITLRLLGEVAGKPDWPQRYFTDALQVNFDALKGMIERARARGELRADVDTLLIMNLISGPVFYNFLLSLFIPGNPTFPVDQFVDVLWEGLSAHKAEH